ncbi:MAG: hypothetical protein NTX85_02960 [Candidatus Nomurabacteria bacterium]|nr:hypothetical protein [Candidatus Nomurabacteria bacterium]
MSEDNIGIYQQKIECTIEELADIIKLSLGNVLKKVRITYRVKNAEDLKAKIVRKQFDNVFSIHDVYGIRIIVGSVSQAYIALGIMRDNFPGYLANDFIKNPKVLSDLGLEGKSFKCLRFVAYKNNTSFEIQITTEKFHRVNESHHDVYHKTTYNL